MKFTKILMILSATFLLTTIAVSEEKKDCSQVKNYAKKLECKLSSATKGITTKVDTATEGITEKKSLFDFFKKKKND